MNAEIPLLKRNARISQLDDRVVIEYLQDEITLEGRAAELFGKMLPNLDGKTGLDNIAARVGEQPNHVRLLATQLTRAGVLTLLGGAAAVTEDPHAVS